MACLLACNAEATSAPSHHVASGAGAATASGGLGGAAGASAPGTGGSSATGGRLAAAGTTSAGGTLGSSGSSSAAGKSGSSGSSSAGSAGASSGGSGGTTAAAPICPSIGAVSAGVLNDSEGLDASGNDSENGVASGWFLYGGTGSGTVTPNFATPKDGITAGHGGMVFEFTGTAMGSSYWGVGAGIWLTPCVDASALTGLSFWIQSDTTVKVELSNPETTSTQAGGDCASGCVPNFATVPPNGAGAAVELPFTAFSGGNQALDEGKLQGVTFSVISPGGSTWNFDVALDDIGFY